MKRVVDWLGSRVEGVLEIINIFTSAVDVWEVDRSKVLLTIRIEWRQVRFAPAASREPRRHSLDPLLMQAAD